MKLAALLLLATASAAALAWHSMSRLRRIEVAAREAVDAAGTERWPVNCDRLRAALGDPDRDEPVALFV